MDIGIISTRYAKALMGYARKVGVEDEVYQAMKMLDLSFRNKPALKAALANPVMNRDDKAVLIRTAMVGNASLSTELSNFVSLVLDNGREGLIHFISLSYISLYRNAHHIGVAKLTTAVTVNEQMKERISQKAGALLHAQMEVQTEVNPDILGGFIFDINDYRMDASIATQLSNVKKQFIDKNKRIV